MDAYLNEYIVNMMDNQEYREGIVFFPLWNKIKSIFVRQTIVKTILFSFFNLENDLSIDYQNISKYCIQIGFYRINN